MTTSGVSELEDFPTLTARYQRELLAHCYRMSGSVHEAEDLVQETLLRAWKASADFEGRSSVRTWLYRIATNVCLTNLESRPRRPLPTGLGTRRPAGRRRPRARRRDPLARAGARRGRAGRREGLHPARLRGRAAAPARPPARRAHPARRAALVCQGGGRGPRHLRGRGQLGAPARARPARREGPHRGHRDPRPRRAAATAADGVRRRVLAQGHRRHRRACSRPTRSGRCRPSPTTTAAPRTSGA